MQMTIYHADCSGNSANCSYKNKVEVTSVDDMVTAVSKDHVCATYTNNYRNEKNFLESDVIPMDIDNDHSEDPNDWITEDKMVKMFGSINYVLVPSRNYMKAKDGKDARPKYHVYFPIDPIKSSEEYKNVKSLLQNIYPFFDANALDAARFLFGTDVDANQIVWNEGWMSILDDIDTADSLEDDDVSASGTISQGNRNNTLSRFAGRVLKKYGITDKAKDAFLENSKRCDPPLDSSELKAIWKSAVTFYRNTIMTQPGYVPPDEYNMDFKSLKPEDYSDIGEARVLVREYKDELLYTDATEFLSYDGVCWRENRQKAVGIVEEFLDMQLADAREQYISAVKALINSGIPEDIVSAGGKTLSKAVTDVDIYKNYLDAKEYFAFVMKYRNYKNIINTQNTAKPMVAADINMFDAQENYLNTPEATYDLSKGILGAKSHSASDLLTKITNVSPGDEGKDIWEDALQVFFCGDQELIDYVQETVGLAAIGKVYEEALVLASGEGRNGKSTYWNTVSRVLGNYSGTISADALTTGCRRNVKPEIAELKGKRLIIAAELEEGVRLSTSILKQLCSTDQIRGEKKFKDPFDFTPSHTVVLYTNHLPKVGATDEGTWRRLIVIPFHAKIDGASDIKNYSDYLYEHAAPAILSWIIEGARKVIEHDHKPVKPKVVLDAIASYRGMNDWMGIFLDECCDIGDGLECRSSDLYEEFKAYCTRTGEYPRSNADFVQELDKRDFYRKKKKSGMWVQGVQPKNIDFIE